MFFRYPFNQSLIERLTCIEIIQKILIIFYSNFIPTAPSSNLRERSAVANNALRLNFVYNGLKRLLVTRETMWLVNNDHGLCCPKSIERTIKTLCAVIVIIAPQQTCISAIAFRVTGQELHVYQKDINLLRILTTALNEITYYAGEIATALFLVLGSFKHAKFNFCTITTPVGKMPARIFILHKLRSTRFNSQRRYRNNELVDTVTLMQLKDGFGIHIGLSSTSFHLDVQI